MSWGKRQILIVLGFALPLFWIGWAKAGIEEAFGFSSEGIALGGAYASLASDSSAAYYNPAGLAGFPRWNEQGLTPSKFEGEHGLGLDFGLVFGLPQLRWSLTGAYFEDKGVPNAAGGIYGMSVDLDQVVGIPFIALGVAAYVPFGTMFAYSNENITHPIWIRYHDDYHTISVYPAVAFSPVKYVSVGFGLRFSMEIESYSDLNYYREENCRPELECSHVEMGEDITIRSNFAYLAGITIQPIKPLRVSFVWRQGTNVYDFGRTVTEQIPVIGDYEYHHLFSHYHHPHQFELAASWEAQNWLVAASATYNVWNDYVDPYRRKPIPEFEDTVTVRMGGGIPVGRATRLMLGYAYEPSPVPDQTMFSNFLDCDRHILSVGTQTRLDKLFGWNSLRVAFGWHFQYQILPERSYVKDRKAIEEYIRSQLKSVEVETTDGGTEPLDDETIDELTKRYTDRILGTEPDQNGKYPEFKFSGYFYSLGFSVRFIF